MNDEPRTLLIVEDDQRFADTLAAEFRDRGYDVLWLDSLQAVERQPDLSRHQYAVVDLRLRQDSGLDVISTLKERSPDTTVVVLTGYGSIATAVKATKLGATSYLTKPVDVDQLERAFAGEEGEEIAIPDEFQSLYRHEREYIEYVLAECDGNISQAARRLGLHRQSLQRKLRKYTPN
ncbi:MAG: response regulator [Deltaproteobacteria bacterium]|jgi:two-component system response regulator RegA|nr:response regulator [Deltaproteobacteria bacterium]MBW2384894.1 response regulator [Deltaproteobacteria bacterium]MBW2697412.1 response regulator [Deltaproteobacteria bacterium]